MKHPQLCPLLLLVVVLWVSSLSQGFARAPATAKIAFTSARDGNREIYLMNPDGSDPVNLTRHRADDLSPAWSPTGAQLLFTSDRVRVRDLYVMDADGAHVRRVFRKVAHRTNATWSPDGKQIAYQRYEGSEWFIYVATIAGTQEERLAKGQSPAWSPDGTAIAFMVGLPGHNRIGLLNRRTRVVQLLFPPPLPPWQWHPAWSASADLVAFAWFPHPLRGGKVPVGFFDRQTIYVARRDGTGIELVVPEAGPKAAHPVWSPRGDALLYQQEIGGQLQIFKIDVVHRVPIQLTQAVAFDTYQANTLAAWFDPATLPVSPESALLTTQWSALKAKGP